MFKMEKHIQRQDSNLQFNKTFPGCFWSIFHTIDYHRWHNVRKMLPHKKHSKSKGDSTKSAPSSHHVAEVPEEVNDEDKSLMCTAESCPIDRKPREGHVSEVMAEELSEEESQKYWKLSSNSKRRLSRTQSIHHLEPSYYSPGYNGEKGDIQKTPMKVAASGIRNNSLNAMDSENYFIQRKIALRLTSFTEKSIGVKKTLETDKINRNNSGRSFKEDAHIQEIFKANRKLFAELLQGAHVKDTLQTPQNKKSAASLAKSMSFPAPGSARKGYKKLSSHQHKQIESFPKVQKSVSHQPSKLVEFGSPKNFHEDMTPCDSDSTSNHDIRQQTTSSSLESNRGQRHGGWNQLVVKRFNFIKQKIRHSFKEKKKGNNQKISKGIQTLDSSRHGSLGTTTSEDGSGIRGSETGSSVNDKLSSGGQSKAGNNSSSTSRERYLQLSDGSGITEYSETDNSENDNNLSSRVQTKTGTVSLSTSLERYAQLSEHGFNKNREAKGYHSQSLRLIGEEKISNMEKPQKKFGRNLSLPDIDLFCTLFTDPPHTISRTEKSNGVLAHLSTDNNIRTDENMAPQLDAHVCGPLDNESLSMIEKGDDNMLAHYSGSLNEVTNDEGTASAYVLQEKIPHLDISDGKHDQASVNECIVEDVSETLDHVSEPSHINQVLELETCFQDDETSKLPDSEGSIQNPGCSIANELEPSVDQPSEAEIEALPTIEAEIEALPTIETIVNPEIIDDAEKISNYLHLQSELGRLNSADFNYMRYVLQLASFIESGHAIDRPLNSSIFEGEEAHFYKKLEYYWEKVDKDSDHQLLLDLVYETLQNIYEKSFICFLKSFSSRSQSRPMALGQYLLEEVREKVSWYLSLGPELDQSLDDVVGRDLRKGDGWMNLQSETEHIALDLEELILDELLDEVISL